MEALQEIYDSIAKNLALIIGNDTDANKLIKISPVIEKHIFYLRKFCSKDFTNSLSLNSSAMSSFSIQDSKASGGKQSVEAKNSATVELYMKMLIEIASKMCRLNMRKYNFVMLASLSAQNLIRNTIESPK